MDKLTRTISLVPEAGTHGIGCKYVTGGDFHGNLIAVLVLLVVLW